MLINAFSSCYLKFMYLPNIYKIICQTRNLEVDGGPSKENLFGQSWLLMNAMYIVFPYGDL